LPRPFKAKRELEATQEKLRGLERLYAATLAAYTGNGYGRELMPRSWRRVINQLMEEITRFHARTGSAAPDRC
jgi:hypothetical protein